MDIGGADWFTWFLNFKIESLVKRLDTLIIENKSKLVMTNVSRQLLSMVKRKCISGAEKDLYILLSHLVRSVRKYSSLEAL